METASQTAGPFLHIGLMPRLAGIEGVYAEELGRSPVAPGAKGTPITVTGTIFDGAGAPVLDAMIESWQADAAGHYPGAAGADPMVTGFCRFASDAETGQFTLKTIKPGPTAGREGQGFAPHIALWIVARGINRALQTRIYFADEPWEGDPILTRIAPTGRVQSLMAEPVGEGAYRFDIRLQGADETVFFDL